MRFTTILTNNKISILIMANFVKIPLRTATPPECCEKCPLIGIIPKEHRQRGTRQSYCCLGVWPHEPLTSKGISVDVEDKRKRTGHITHRVCEDRWETWWQQPDHAVNISKDSYRFCRLPYESRQQLEFNFKKR